MAFVVKHVMDSKYEYQKFKQGYNYIVGCDEVGRGCLAGPVVAAAVILDFRFNLPAGEAGILDFRGIKDSKLLSPKKREELSQVIKQSSVAWGIGLVEHSIIDEINIHHASLKAMRLAVDSLKMPIPMGIFKDALLAIDGKFIIPNYPMEQEAVIDGDAKVLSIAAASIIAKVYRDNLMQAFDKQYPRYKFGQHKGYATAIHRRAIIDHGLTPIHRLSFCSNYV